MSNWYQTRKKGLAIYLRVQPGSRENRFGGVRDDRLLVRIAVPPVDGKANKQLVRFIARQFGVRQSDIKLLSGQDSRNKTLLVLGLTAPPPGTPA